MWRSPDLAWRRASALLLLLLMLILRSIGAAEDGLDVVIIGAGMAGIAAGKTLSEKGVTNFVILEATDRIGGRIRRGEFSGVPIELGANWVEGVNGPHLNPIWKLAQDIKLRTSYSDFDNISSNIYGNSGYISAAQTAEAYNASSESFDFGEELGARRTKEEADDTSILFAQRVFGSVPTTPVAMALDYFDYDYEYAEPPRTTSLENTQPLPTFANYGYDEYFVADKRGYVAIVEHLALGYLKHDKEEIHDSRLKLNKVVKHIEHSSKRVKIVTHDGTRYDAKAVILTVSLGVLQSGDIKFRPPLPEWKLDALWQYDMAIYTKIFLKFAYRFWDPAQEFFLYADRRRGYYPVWQTLEGEYPGSNILLVTVTDDESRRIEQQDDSLTLAEITVVLRTMFGETAPQAEEIFVSRWWTNQYFRGSFSNWPIGLTHVDFALLQTPVNTIYFSGEHVSEQYNGYVQGAYFSGIGAAESVARDLTGSNK